MVKKATRIPRFVTAVEDQPVAVGLDVHEKADWQINYTCPSGEAVLARQQAELAININISPTNLDQPALRFHARIQRRPTMTGWMR